jgi:hypothetical protein
VRRRFAEGAKYFRVQRRAAALPSGAVSGRSLADDEDPIFALGGPAGAGRVAGRSDRRMTAGSAILREFDLKNVNLVPVRMRSFVERTWVASVSNRGAAIRNFDSGERVMPVGARPAAKRKLPRGMCLIVLRVR